MKNKALKITDFEVEKLNKDAQKVVRGGDGDPPIEQNNPIKNGGGGNG